jgi:hypothetical protein
LTYLNDVDGQGDYAVYKALSAVVPEQRARMLTAAQEYYAKSKTATHLKVMRKRSFVLLFIFCLYKDACSNEIKLIRMEMDAEGVLLLLFCFLFLIF